MSRRSKRAQEPVAPPITRADIEAKFGELRGEVDERTEAAKVPAIAIAVGAVVVTVDRRVLAGPAPGQASARWCSRSGGSDVYRYAAPPPDLERPAQGRRRLDTVAGRRDRRRRAPSPPPRRPGRRGDALPHRWSRPATCSRSSPARSSRRGGGVPPVLWLSDESRPMRVVLRNPRRELDVPRLATSAGCSATSTSSPESVLVIRNDTLATHDEGLARRGHRRDPAGRLGRRGVKCGRCREPAVIEVRRHNAGYCRGVLPAALRRAGPPGDRAFRHVPRGRSGARGRVRRQGLPRSLAAAARARLRGRRPLRRPGHRRVLRHVGSLRARVRGRARLEVGRGRPRDTIRVRRRERVAGREAGSLFRVRAVEASRLQRGRDRRTATTCSRRATTSTTRPRCSSATCCVGRPSISAASTPCSAADRASCAR